MGKPEGGGRRGCDAFPTGLGNEGGAFRAWPTSHLIALKVMVLTSSRHLLNAATYTALGGLLWNKCERGVARVSNLHEVWPAEYFPIML